MTRTAEPNPKPAKKPKALKHQWTPRPDFQYLCYCTVCGVYEDEVTLTRHTRTSLTVSNVKVYRPYRQPEASYEGRKQPPCVPLADGPAEAPPPRVDRMGEAIETALRLGT